ncbi:MAG: hypothetical protein WBC44_07590 [Planctomycetaceae bacterium]
MFGAGGEAVRVGEAFDGYSGRVHSSGRLEPGELDITTGVHRLRVTVTDRNRLSEGFKFGLDAVEVIPVP